MDAGVRFDRIHRVQFVIHFVSFYRDRQQVWVRYGIERIARLLRAHPAPHGGKVVAVGQRDEQQQRVDDFGDDILHRHSGGRRYSRIFL